jgi:hypothetical protein
MPTVIDVASERGSLVSRLIRGQNPMWFAVNLSRISYDDQARTYTCYLRGNSAGGFGCMNHPCMKHEDARAVIWFQVTIYGIRQRCLHRTFTNKQTGVKCKSYVSPYQRKGYTTDVMIRLFPSSVPIRSSASPRPRLALPLSVQDIYNQVGSNYDVLAHEEWFNQPSLH